MSASSGVSPKLVPFVNRLKNIYRGQGPDYSSFKNFWGVNGGDEVCALHCIKCGTAIHKIDDFVSGYFYGSRLLCEEHTKEEIKLTCDMVRAKIISGQDKVYQLGRVQISKVEQIVINTLLQKTHTANEWVYLGWIDITVPF